MVQTYMIPWGQASLCRNILLPVRIRKTPIRFHGDDQLPVILGEIFDPEKLHAGPAHPNSRDEARAWRAFCRGFADIFS